MTLGTLNWKRGMLRLWAVASVLWVSIVFFVTKPVEKVRNVFPNDWHDVLQFDRLHPMAVDPPVSLKDASFPVGGKPPGTATFYISVEMPDGTIILGVPSETTKDQLSKKFPGHLGSPKSPGILDNVEVILVALTGFALLAFIPPSLVLALGFTGLWIRRGFIS